MIEFLNPPITLGESLVLVVCFTIIVMSILLEEKE